MRCSGWLCLGSLITLLMSPSPAHGSIHIVSYSPHFAPLTSSATSKVRAFRKIGRTTEKVLHVGDELFKETLPLQNGACLYHLQGLRPQTLYEVKISYPASIPALFSLQLRRGTSELGLNQGRKLLNTEKLIFKTDKLLPLVEQDEMSVLVIVEPEGVVAMPGKQERQYIIFNIVCDELLLGIPHKAWYVVVLGVVCLVLAFVVPAFLPRFLLQKNERRALCDRAVTKDS